MSAHDERLCFSTCGNSGSTIGASRWPGLIEAGSGELLAQFTSHRAIQGPFHQCLAGHDLLDAFALSAEAGRSDMAMIVGAGTSQSKDNSITVPMISLRYRIPPGMTAISGPRDLGNPRPELASRPQTRPHTPRSQRRICKGD